ncbi:glucose-6-phosphate isomerase [Azospira sp. I13]|uniref:glucose-6-phosphate isomerase n=1 Tax=Azospira sp. I13 TaxID=1765050 RepID=UPI000D488D4D|nr:glucose-6-phosphate isomerase [Azospira sp. I13]GBG01996.1 glucose-6-phosphate isomerase [Azospira sp. I13]
MTLDITHSDAWQALLAHRQAIGSKHLRELFALEPQRFEHLSCRLGDFLADFSKQRIATETLPLLTALARAADVEGWRDRMFAGETINVSENRAVLHPALRFMGTGPFPGPERDVMPDVRAVRAQMRQFSERVRSGLWRGYSGEAIRHVVNLGIGGSDLGPKMAARALSAYDHPALHVHFVSNLDGAQLAPLLETLDPRSTLFIIASKTFTTQETLRNAQTARDWLLAAAGPENEAAALARHFVAVTAAPAEAGLFGLSHDNIFTMWDWVGGRYSLWSAVGLALALAIGMTQFERLLSGAQALDKHFQEAPLERNLPVLMALIGIWNTNFLGASTLAILPYNESLRSLPGYLQQLEMESNGKMVNRNGQPLSCQPNPIVWGEIGINGQHAFFQLLHQGGWLIPSDFIVAATSDYPLPGHNGPLLANCLAQSAALAFGRTEAEARAELELEGRSAAEIQEVLPYKVFAGNQPATTLLLPRLDPYHLGLLIALYEHKVFVQGVIWGINSFDQWGVELGKKLAGRLLPALEGTPDDGLDDSTRGLIAYCRRHGQL